MDINDIETANLSEQEINAMTESMGDLYLSLTVAWSSVCVLLILAFLYGYFLHKKIRKGYEAHATIAYIIPFYQFFTLGYIVNRATLKTHYSVLYIISFILFCLAPFSFPILYLVQIYIGNAYIKIFSDEASKKSALALNFCSFGLCGILKMTYKSKESIIEFYEDIENERALKKAEKKAYWKKSLGGK